MANDLRASVSGEELTDTKQKLKATNKLGYDFTSLAEEDVLNTVWEMIKPLNEQQRNLRQQMDEVQKYLIKAFGRDADSAASQGAKGNTGAAGSQGIQGIQGSKGDTGPQGASGADSSAFTGTQAFLTSTRGATKTITVSKGLITGIR